MGEKGVLSSRILVHLDLSPCSAIMYNLAGHSPDRNVGALNNPTEIEIGYTYCISHLPRSSTIIFHGCILRMGFWVVKRGLDRPLRLMEAHQMLGLLEALRNRLTLRCSRLLFIAALTRLLLRKRLGEHIRGSYDPPFRLMGSNP